MSLLVCLTRMYYHLAINCHQLHPTSWVFTPLEAQAGQSKISIKLHNLLYRTIKYPVLYLTEVVGMTVEGLFSEVFARGICTIVYTSNQALRWTFPVPVHAIFGGSTDW